MPLYGIVALCVSAVVVVAFLLFILPSLWFRAFVSGAYVPLFKIMGFRVRGVDARAVVHGYIKARKFGLDVTVEQLETIALSEHDVTMVIRDTITPRVIETPIVTTVCKNGVELSAGAKITIKTNLKRLVGGARKETVIARVCEGIVECIGSAASQHELLERPTNISRQLLLRNYAHDASFDILSIDIAEIKVGRKISAEFDVANLDGIEIEIPAAPATEMSDKDIWGDTVMEIEPNYDDVDLLFPRKKTRLA